MNASKTLNNWKTLNTLQVDISLLNMRYAQLFEEKDLKLLNDDVQFLHQLGMKMLISQESASSPDICNIAFKASIEKAVLDSETVIKKLPATHPTGSDKDFSGLKDVLGVFIADCQAIQAIIPVQGGDK